MAAGCEYAVLCAVLAQTVTTATPGTTGRNGSGEVVHYVMVETPARDVLLVEQPSGVVGQDALDGVGGGDR